MQQFNNMGINYNSPTIQAMNNQYYSNAPTFGNIGGLGYNGGVNPFLNNCMNGGYYSGYYNYNPQEIMRQMEEQRRAAKAAIQNQIDIQKMKARIFGTHNNVQIDEDYLDKYYDPATYSEIQKDLDEYDEMVRLSQISNDPSRIIGLNYYAMNHHARVSEEIRSKHPVDQSFTDFMNTAGDLYREALINESSRNLRKNISNTYDKQAFSQLANIHNSSFASLRQSLTIDDLSISLPKHLQQNSSYQERKNQFLNFITNNDVRNRGGL